MRFSIELTGDVRRMMGNIILHIPHASLCLPPDFWRDITVDKEIIERELRFIADYKVDELVKNIDSHKIIAKYSRLYCDVERFRDDKVEPMTELGMGATYTHLSGGMQYRKIGSSRREEILIKSYDLHHKRLNTLSREIVDRYGSCVIIDIHSYSDELVRRLFGWTDNLPDICLGYDEKWFSKDNASKLKTYIEGMGYSCELNYPYSGALVPMEFYHDENPKIQSVMLEINRRVYLNGGAVSENAVCNIDKIINFIAENLDPNPQPRRQNVARKVG